MSPAALTELEAALLQATITLGLAALCGFLWARYRKRYFLWWSVAWLLYVLRIGAIVGFLTTTKGWWLYTHQVLTGWTALALLASALVFSQQLRWRRRYLPLLLFPPLWSYVAIYRLDNFLLAAGPAVLFLSFATLWTGWTFHRYHRRVGSRGAALLAGVLLLWGLHHLDYPLLRARGAWNPWGYYLDILFVLAMGTGIIMLVIEDLDRGLRTLSVLSGDLQHAGRGGDAIDALLGRPLSLAGVRGSALLLGTDDGGRFVRGVGTCEQWTGTGPAGALRATLGRAIARGRPEIARDSDAAPHAYAAILPILRDTTPVGALVIVGDERDPFTALGESFLVALGQQVGAALENAELYHRLELRRRELEHLATRMVQQHEEERRRVSLELHDETAQVFSAVKMQLGLLRESAEPALGSRLDHVLALVDTGIGSIRNVTSDLRPPLLDDLGLLPALRALVAGFAERAGGGLAIDFDAPPSLRPLAEGAELALFRALQEALSNVARHATASHVWVRVRERDGEVELEVRDDGRGFAAASNGSTPGSSMGLAGMRERLGALGGGLELRSPGDGGATIVARVPFGGEGSE